MRAEELLVELWKQVLENREKGRGAEAVILTPAQYRILQEYRKKLGDLPNPDLDYLTPYTLFNLPIFIDSSGWGIASKSETPLTSQ